MEQIVKLPNQSMSSYLCHYLQNGAVTIGGITDTSKDLIKDTATTLTKSVSPSLLHHSQLAEITPELLDVFLYGKRKIQEINLGEAKRQKTAKNAYDRKSETDTKGLSICCDKCQSYHGHGVPCHEPLNILRQLVGSTVHDIKLTYAVMSFPPEVHLCTSTIPGYTYGVCAKQPFPVGTWIGPYEGKRVQAEELRAKNDSSYVWEIYDDGKFSHFLDGNDENSSSWMRYIRCARHKGEQNMVVFQYGQNIYYRAVRDIVPGAELLVWYNNNYTQFLGVPLGLRNVPGTKKGGNVTTEQQTLKTESCSPASQEDVKTFVKEQSIGNNSRQVAANSTTPVDNSRPIQTTTTTYSYSTANPTQSSMKYMSLNSIQPTVTIEHRPIVKDAIISQNPMTAIPDNAQRLQYLATPTSGDVNTNYFMLSTTNQPPSSSSSNQPPSSSTSNQPPSSSCSTTSVSIFQDDHDSECEQGGPWKCNQCQQTFNQRLLFQMHMCCKTPDKPYQCGHCSDSFATPSELRNHVLSHSNDRPFKCGLCGRSFSGPQTLNNHMNTHYGERPFLCQNCGRTFSIATQLSRHMRTPGECPMAQNVSVYQSDVATPFTSTLTRG